MDRPESLVGRAVGGAYICKDWELRVTARCLDEDLHADAETTFAAVEGIEIIKAFKKDRASEPGGPKTISPLSSGETVYRLAYGHDHRGGTYYDEEEAVIWLVAFGRHRSGKPDDFYPVASSSTLKTVYFPSRSILSECTVSVTNASLRPSPLRRRSR
jgi:hypothetical protein